MLVREYTIRFYSTTVAAGPEIDELGVPTVLERRLRHMLHEPGPTTRDGRDSVLDRVTVEVQRAHNPGANNR